MLFCINHRINLPRFAVYRQSGSRDLGPWCVEMRHRGARHHIARHTTKYSALAHAEALRLALRWFGGK